jgi:hypothetical protein
LKAISLILVLAIFSMAVIPVNSVSNEEVRSELIRVYVELQKAEQSGCDVTLLARELDQAAGLLAAGSEDNVTRASFLIGEVNLTIPSLVAEASQAVTMRQTWTAITLVILGVFTIIVLVYGNKIYWGLWLRIRGSWKVERS